jgi:acid phosphatase (class A)
MRMHRAAVTAFFGFILLSALAGDAGAALLAPAERDGSLLLPPPPAIDSAMEKTEIAELHAIISAATPQQLAAAARDAQDQKPDLFNTVLGFDITRYPATMKLLNEAAAESNTGAVKSFFHRPRPWVADPAIPSCVSHLGRPGDDSYPSGHSTYAFTLGVVLAALLPDKAGDILARAADFAHNRMVCGYHFHSDIVGGQTYGTLIAARLLDNPVFKTDFAAASAELKARP